MSEEAMESFVKSKITEYQDLFQIEVLFWFVRKSTIRGLGRKASDLDLVFIYRSMNPGPVKILFERYEKRNEIQCWNIEDVFACIRKKVEIFYQGGKNNGDEETKLFEHYFLDYFDGFYIGLFSDRKGYGYHFESKMLPVLKQVFEPKIIMQDILNNIDLIQRKWNQGYFFSIGEVLNQVWSILFCKDLLYKGLDAQVNIDALIMEYLDDDLVAEVKEDLRIFRQSLHKQSNYGRYSQLFSMIFALSEQLKQQMDESVTEIRYDFIIQQLDEVRKGV